MAIMEPNHNPSSQWLSPAQCTEYQRVRALYESHHMAGARWDELCSVIVALPTLLGHHRVFERLGPPPGASVMVSPLDAVQEELR